MRAWYRLLRALLLIGLWAAVPARAFDEGIDYKRLAQAQPTETGAKVEVLELFWYGCPHCYQMEPALKTWLSSLPANVEFRRMPAMLGPSWEPHGRAYYAMEQMGVLERLHMPLFRAMHEEKKRLPTPDAIADWVAEQGVNREEFLAAYNSFSVEMRVRKAKEMVRKYGIDGVPALIVNGKYQTSPGLTASTERMLKVVDELIARETPGAAPAAPAGEMAPPAAPAQ